MYVTFVTICMSSLHDPRPEFKTNHIKKVEGRNILINDTFHWRNWMTWDFFFLKLLHGIYKDLYVNCISSHEFYCETAVSWKCTLNRCIVCFFSIFSDYCQCLENICFIGKRNASNIFTYFPRYKHEWGRDRNQLIELRRIHVCN